MVVATVISTQGVFSEVTVPPRTADVLEWLRKKYKQAGMQFQGNLVNDAVRYSVFATPADEDDENQHMLPPPFHDDTFQGTIALLKTKTGSGDEYEKPASAYLDLTLLSTMSITQEFRLTAGKKRRKQLWMTRQRRTW